jgi:hypothetical protein
MLLLRPEVAHTSNQSNKKSPLTGILERHFWTPTPPTRLGILIVTRSDARSTHQRQRHVSAVSVSNSKAREWLRR